MAIPPAIPATDVAPSSAPAKRRLGSVLLLLGRHAAARVCRALFASMVVETFMAFACAVTIPLSTFVPYYRQFDPATRDFSDDLSFDDTWRSG